jgi:hypothetical protein
MIYQKFLASLLSGSFAAFTALRSNHVVHMKEVQTVGLTSTLLLRCSMSGILMQRLALSSWVHEQKIVQNAAGLDSVKVSDTMTWDRICQAKRAYMVSTNQDGSLNRKIIDPWSVRYKGGNSMMNSIVSKSMQKELVKADQVIFNEFLAQLH